MAFQKFSLTEIIVIAFILVILAALLLPMIGSHKGPALRVRSQVQLTMLTKACESYQMAFGEAPGYFDDEALEGDIVTGNENLMLSLLGGVVPSKISATDTSMPTPPDGWSIDPASVGIGPQTDRGQRYGCFYSPKPDELAAITGTTGSDNPMPELVEQKSGLPILYYRFNSTRDSDGGVGDRHGDPFKRDANNDYFNASKLIGPAGSIDVSDSLLRDDQPGGAAAADAMLMTLATDPKTREMSGSWLLVSPGPDGVWFDADDHHSDGTLDPDSIEDVWRVGG